MRSCLAVICLSRPTRPRCHPVFAIRTFPARDRDLAFRAPVARGDVSAECTWRGSQHAGDRRRVGTMLRVTGGESCPVAGLTRGLSPRRVARGPRPFAQVLKAAAGRRPRTPGDSTPAAAATPVGRCRWGQGDVKRRQAADRQAPRSSGQALRVDRHRHGSALALAARPHSRGRLPPLDAPGPRMTNQHHHDYICRTSDRRRPPG